MSTPRHLPQHPAIARRWQANGKRLTRWPPPTRFLHCARYILGQLRNQYLSLSFTGVPRGHWTRIFYRRCTMLSCINRDKTPFTIYCKLVPLTPTATTLECIECKTGFLNCFERDSWGASSSKFPGLSRSATLRAPLPNQQESESAPTFLGRGSNITKYHSKKPPTRKLLRRTTKVAANHAATAEIVLEYTDTSLKRSIGSDVEGAVNPKKLTELSAYDLLLGTFGARLRCSGSYSQGLILPGYINQQNAAARVFKTKSESVVKEDTGNTLKWLHAHASMTEGPDVSFYHDRRTRIGVKLNREGSKKIPATILVKRTVLAKEEEPLKRHGLKNAKGLKPSSRRRQDTGESQHTRAESRESVVGGGVRESQIISM
ncbi:hypothetical protein R3P38DRAFT_2815609 [Favolaschia claudopus]|uniref:Uncharacterized protein n=1 Tax=Favolaschia claudopus TaxID=2862362 RepID=A0AAV9Z0Z0_9AGAR